MVLVSFLVMIYYNIIIAYSFHYLFSGFQKTLPWTKCNMWWNSLGKLSINYRLLPLVALSSTILIGQVIFKKHAPNVWSKIPQILHYQKISWIVELKRFQATQHCFWKQTIPLERIGTTIRNLPIWIKQIYLTEASKHNLLKNIGCKYFTTDCSCIAQSDCIIQWGHMF